MVLLAFSFISAFFLLHRHENLLTIWYYKFAAVWTGFLIHFVVAIAAIWLMTGFAGLAGFSVNTKTLATFLLSAAACWALYGMWGAFHPMVRRATIELKNLPAAWQGRTIVQLSDVHLGYFNDEKFAERMVDQVNALHPDIVVITGDLLDGMGGSFDRLTAPLNRLSAPYGVLFITGNHEYYIGIDRVLSVLKKTKLRILNNEMININGLEFVGVNYPGIISLSDIANLPAADKTEHPRVLLFHTPTNLQLRTGGSSDHHFSTYWKPDTSYAANKILKPDIQLSGHTHHGQIFPFNFLTHWLFKGHDYGFSQGDGLLIYTSCGTGSWGPPLRTTGRPEIVLFRLQSAEKN